MYKMKLRIVIMIISTLLIFSCGEKKEQQDKKQDTVEHFEQNPIAITEQQVSTLTIGSTAPDFNLIGSGGQYYTLGSFDDAKVLVIIFTCNHCPTAQAYEDRIISISHDYKNKSVQVVAISPNSPLGLMYEELGYSDLNDDYVEMEKRAKNKKFNFPYLYDGDDHKASLLYGPVATPHAFVFDQDRVLQYVGRIDSKERPGYANGEDLRAAIDAVLLNQIPTLAQTKTFGCSTKWAWKKDLKTKIDKEWANKEVTLSDIDDQGVTDLLSNNSNKLRLINVWATWCGPCIIEYPQFVETHRMFMGRDFEFVSISTDQHAKREKALKILTKNQSSLNNFIFSKEDKYALIEQIDPDWNGALPYTMLIEPGGNVVYKHQGEVDFYKLKKTIVDHQMIGRYF